MSRSNINSNDQSKTHVEVGLVQINVISRQGKVMLNVFVILYVIKGDY